MLSDLGLSLISKVLNKFYIKRKPAVVIGGKRSQLHISV